VTNAENQGNELRFVNSSCKPNCVPKKRNIFGQPAVYFETIKDIQEGEDITINYNFRPFQEQAECYCGESNCTGFIGPAPTRMPAGSAVVSPTSEPPTGKRKRRDPIDSRERQNPPKRKADNASISVATILPQAMDKCSLCNEDDPPTDWVNCNTCGWIHSSCADLAPSAGRCLPDVWECRECLGLGQPGQTEGQTSHALAVTESHVAPPTNTSLPGGTEQSPWRVTASQARFTYKGQEISMRNVQPFRGNLGSQPMLVQVNGRDMALYYILGPVLEISEVPPASPTSPRPTQQSSIQTDESFIYNHQKFARRVIQPFHSHLTSPPELFGADGQDWVAYTILIQVVS
jgi:hypothetical protein